VGREQLAQREHQPCSQGVGPEERLPERSSSAEERGPQVCGNVSSPQTSERKCDLIDYV